MTLFRTSKIRLKALEKLLVDMGMTEAATLAHLAEDWRFAAIATPHGQPIPLENKTHRH